MSLPPGAASWFLTSAEAASTVVLPTEISTWSVHGWPAVDAARNGVSVDGFVWSHTTCWITPAHSVPSGTSSVARDRSVALSSV